MLMTVDRRDLTLDVSPTSALANLLPPMPVGAVEQKIISVWEDFAADAYRVEIEYRYPFGQLSIWWRD